MNSPLFTTQLLGQTEKALNAILLSELAGTGLNEHRWIALTLAVTSDPPASRGELAARLADGLKTGDVEALAHIDELVAARLVEIDADTVIVTEHGHQLHGRIRARVTEITHRMWGDLPPEALATAGHVLSTVLERANAELATA